MRRCSLVLAIATTALTATACGDNNRRTLDGGMSDAGMPDAPPDAPPDTPPPGAEVTCEVLASSTDTCVVTSGNANKLIKGIVLTPARVYTGGQVAIDTTGHITCVGCNCATGDETTITCPSAVISPGLINTHDHITFTQNSPYSDTGERYEDRQQWRIGLDQHHVIPADGGASADQVRWGELRFLMGGATSIVGSGGQAGLVRNLDSTTNQEGLGKKAVRFDTFPLDDAGGRRRIGDCDYGGTPTTAAAIASVDAYEPHTSEGIDTTARNEFLCESSLAFDTSMPGVSDSLMLGKTAMIHAIGLAPADYGAMAAAGTALIWSPRSNITLYGDTARVTTAARLGVKIALGTDWMPTGSMNLLRELACADSFNASYLDHYFSDQQLWRMVTLDPAALTRTDDVIGALAPGKLADIAIFATHGKPPFRSVIEAEPKDVALVLRGGTALYGDDVVVGALAQSCDVVDVCGTVKRVCTMSEVGKAYSALQTAAGASYPAFACGVPPNEPSCVPQRPVSVAGSTVYTGVADPYDSDGDGIPDVADNCPSTFNPVRPVDGGAQGDVDRDGVGDACDPCPFDASTSQCTAVSLADRDHDGVPNTTDNCAETSNADQADADHDGKGDACDQCPMAANMGIGCPTTIYDIKRGLIGQNFAVRVTNALVTGRGSNGFFVQVKDGDAGYAGPEFSGLFVFTGAAPPAAAAVGARVTIDGSVANFQGQIELDTVTSIVATAPGPEEPPAPIAATYAEVATGGSRAAALEGAVVALGPATVIAFDPAFGEITITDGTTTLIVDDFLFAVTPAPAISANFAAVQGVLALRQRASKLLPRNAADLPPGPPNLAALGPALSYARVGTTTGLATFPDPLTITLTGPAQGDTTVTLASSDPAALTVTDVVIPDGASTAPVPVTAVAQAIDVTITATLRSSSQTAHVRVLGDAEGPATVTLSPLASTIAPGASLTLTAALDLPPPADTPVALALSPSDAGTLPATVTVPANQLSATFAYTNQAISGTVQITATLGASTSSSTLTVTTAPNHLVISQVYGGGGNSGSTLKNDFLELHNPTPAAVSLAGMSVQYQSATGTASWLVTPLGDLTIPPGGFVLVQEAAGTAGTVDLPAPDVIGTIAMGAAAGKVALVASTTALSGGCPTAGVIDLVGYGTTATCSEGGAPAPAPSAVNADIRKLNGCLDSNNNGSDFTAAVAAPRNSAAPVAPCL